jgi:hypothetical protein
MFTKGQIEANLLTQQQQTNSETAEVGSFRTFRLRLFRCRLGGVLVQQTQYPAKIPESV